MDRYREGEGRETETDGKTDRGRNRDSDRRADRQTDMGERDTGREIDRVKMNEREREIKKGK